MTFEQLNEYLAAWNEENGNVSTNSKGQKELKNPSFDELEMFNMANGIGRKLVPKK